MASIDTIMSWFSAYFFLVSFISPCVHPSCSGVFSDSVLGLPLFPSSQLSLVNLGHPQDLLLHLMSPKNSL